MSGAGSSSSKRRSWYQRPWGGNASAMNTYAKRLTMNGEIKDQAAMPWSQHLSQDDA
jgi:hypothetical protein